VPEVNTTSATTTQPSEPEAGWVSPLLTRPAAVAAEGADQGVAWHYGDPTREQRGLLAGTTVTDLSHRGVVRVSGPDRLTWLHSMTTQHLSGLAPGVGVETLVLSPHGHVEHALHLVDDGASAWVTVEPGTAPALVDWLRRMQFMLRVEVTDDTAAWAALGWVPTVCVDPDGVGPGHPDGLVLPAGGPPAWDDPWPRRRETTASYAAVADAEHPGLARPWREVLVPRAGLADAVRDARLAGSWAAEALRVAAWRPRLGLETDHRTIPHEVDWLRSAVHLDKGCYRGQETIARVHNLGRPPRRLVLLHLDGSQNVLPAHGAPVCLPDVPDRAIGQVTSAARHHELGPIALALVKRSTPIEAVLSVDGLPAVQEVVVAP
jgi:tRNA-modifying protein YgfZ